MSATSFFNQCPHSLSFKRKKSLDIEIHNFKMFSIKCYNLSYFYFSGYTAIVRYIFVRRVSLIGLDCVSALEHTKPP